MQLRDISFRGLYKILLVVNIVLPALFIPLALIAFWVNPEAFHMNKDGVKFLLMTVNFDAPPLIYGLVALFLAAINAVIQSSFQAIILSLLAKYTAIGNITLTATPYDT